MVSKTVTNTRTGTSDHTTATTMTRERRAQASAAKKEPTGKESAGSKSSSSTPTEESGKSVTNDISDTRDGSSMDNVRDEFDQLGRELNMDVSTLEASWSSYDAIRQNYTLEVSCCFIQLLLRIYYINHLSTACRNHLQNFSLHIFSGQPDALVGLCIVCCLQKLQLANHWETGTTCFNRGKWGVPYQAVALLQIIPHSVFQQGQKVGGYV